MSAYPSHRPDRRASAAAEGGSTPGLAFRLIAGHSMPALHRLEAALPECLPHWRQAATVDAASGARALRITDLIAELAEQQRVHIAAHPDLSLLALRHAQVGPAQPLANLGHEPLADTPQSEVNILVPLVLNPCYRVGLLMAAPDAWEWLRIQVANRLLPDALAPWRRLRDLHCHLLGCSPGQAERSFVDVALQLLGEAPSPAPGSASSER
jgi:hypothetical protein